MGNCAKCGKEFGLYTTRYASGTLYDAEMGFELSLDDRCPENPYREKNLCKKCYKEVYENAPELPVEKSLGSMGNCAKCGNELGFRDKRKSFHMTSYIDAIENGIFPEYNGKQVCISCQQSLLNSKGIEYRGLLAIKRGNERIKELANQLQNEFKNGRFCVNCTFYHKIYNKLESLMLGLSIDPFQPHYCKKLKMNLGNPYGKDAEKCTSYMTVEEYKEALSGEMNKDKANVQIILDFSSLKDVMSKGGLVMATYKCPNCNGMVDIPEAGKVLMCKYCSTPIKPVDIFEKIKSLM